MSPLEQRVADLERKLANLERVENVSFIEFAKRRIAAPLLGRFISKEATGTTSGTLRAVDEGGAATYSVADAYDGTITIEDAEGNTYKLGYYNV